MRLRVGLTRAWGAAAAALLLFLTFGTLAAVAWRAEFSAGFSKADWAALRFTLTQATLSATLSVALAVPLARALARRQFFGRKLLITLLGAPFILPVIVAVLGLLAVFGRAGLFNQTLNYFGYETISIYGLSGVLLAHVFFNLPLATRLILQGWLAVPSERFRLAESLGFSTRDVSRWIERPMLRDVIPGVFVVIFLICVTSFAVALTLGGGPRATTIELAIYQALRFDFDPGKAALLSAVQFAICLVAATLAWKVSVPHGMGAGLDRVVRRRDAQTNVLRGLDGAVIVCAALFLLLPLLMVVWRGAGSLHVLPLQVWQAAGRSVLVALISCALMMALIIPLAILAARPGGGRIEVIGYLTLAASPLVIGTGLFILLFRFVSPQAMALPVTALVNAAMSLPFAMRALVPEVRATEDAFGKLADGLGMRGFARMRLLLLPRLKRPLGFSLGLAAALSMGDLGVVALFSDPKAGTLPLMIYRLMGAYRMQEAAGAALLLLVLSLGLFWIFDRGGRTDADA